jgi:hypothetical protein
MIGSAQIAQTCQVQTESTEATKKATKYTRLLMFSYLPGNVLFHKIALLTKEVRKSLPNSGLLDQIKVIGIKETAVKLPGPFPTQSFVYAISLADSIRFPVEERRFLKAKARLCCQQSNDKFAEETRLCCKKSNDRFASELLARPESEIALYYD